MGRLFVFDAVRARDQSLFEPMAGLDDHLIERGWWKDRRQDPVRQHRDNKGRTDRRCFRPFRDGAAGLQCSTQAPPDGVATSGSLVHANTMLSRSSTRNCSLRPSVPYQTASERDGLVVRPCRILARPAASRKKNPSKPPTPATTQ